MVWVHVIELSDFFWVSHVKKTEKILVKIAVIRDFYPVMSIDEDGTRELQPIPNS